MIRGHLAGGYDEYIYDPFPELMLGNNRYFRDLPYLSPAFKGVLDKALALRDAEAARAGQEWISKMPERADSDTNFHGPRDVGSAPVPEISEGSIVNENA
ncbi:MAG: hypothetical protein H0S85_10685 [Desulfovibrionaceae bacterium]|jgi:hypothetical protein|nr:hypothetical protein [Desulfovibrionaceae bacterium]